jgi:hypothetical protein
MLVQPNDFLRKLDPFKTFFLIDTFPIDNSIEDFNQAFFDDSWNIVGDIVGIFKKTEIGCSAFRSNTTNPLTFNRSNTENNGELCVTSALKSLSKIEGVKGALMSDCFIRGYSSQTVSSSLSKGGLAYPID